MKWSAEWSESQSLLKSSSKLCGEACLQKPSGEASLLPEVLQIPGREAVIAIGTRCQQEEEALGPSAKENGIMWPSHSKTWGSLTDS